ncbi:MAG: GIY-YIG nuclease family protein [Verrucomicrobiaceae bacterium]|nr:GIY-YIG nuclease family protein [Verrucomicrobiaceae bacterium]
MSRHSVTSGFRYVYLLESRAAEGGFYTGLTDDLAARLAAHNDGKVSSTRKGRPWEIRVAVAFCDPVRAAAFERYLKSGSGRAFAIRHF